MAGALGHIPICDSIATCHRHPAWRMHAFKLANGKTISCATWIDTIFTFSMSAFGAVDLLKRLEHCLGSRWGLAFKSGSTSVLPCRVPLNHATDPQGTACEKWPEVDCMNVLGHIIQDDAGIRSDWNRTRNCMWASFWVNVGSKHVRNIEPLAKSRLLYRSVVSMFLWKVSRWPFQTSVAQKLDAVQCQMLSSTKAQITPAEEKHEASSQCCLSLWFASCLQVAVIRFMLAELAQGSTLGLPMLR